MRAIELATLGTQGCRRLASTPKVPILRYFDLVRRQSGSFQVVGVAVHYP